MAEILALGMFMNLNQMNACHNSLLNWVAALVMGEDVQKVVSSNPSTGYWMHIFSS